MYSKRLAKLIPILGMSLVAAMALMAPAAGAATPAPGFEAFAGCPSPEENSEVFVCQRAVIDGGHFQMGSKDVPITKPITLSGGLDFTGQVFANKNGGLTPVKQPVPGGVIGLTGLDWLINFLGIEALKLYAVTELAGQPSFGAQRELILPIRVHLENTALGKNCYVGTFANPITLKLITGTTKPPPPNEPITGKNPTEVEHPTNPEIFLFENGTYVDNSFAAPGASGCVLTLFGFFPISINGLVNSQSGLPAAAGTNETVQNFDLEVALQESVYP